MGAQPQPVAAIAAAAPAATATAPQPSSDQGTTSSGGADGGSTATGSTAPAAEAATTATPSTADAVPTDDAADDTSGDAGDGSDPLAGGGGTTLARVALIVVRGDAPARWATAAAGTPARTRAASGTTFTGLAVLPNAPLATGLALIAGQPSNPATRAGCTEPAPMTPGTTDAAGVTAGSGCDYPAETPSIPGAVARDGRTWKAYVGAASPTEAAAKLCQPSDAAAPLRAAAQRSPLGRLGDLTSSGACAAAATPLTSLAADLASDAPPAWLYIEVGDCGTDGCDEAERSARDTELDAALKALSAQAPPEGSAAAIVVGDGDVPDLEPAPSASYPASQADPEAPAAVLSGALLIGDGVQQDATDPLALDPFAIARTQATWLGLGAPGQAAADGTTALALPDA